MKKHNILPTFLALALAASETPQEPPRERMRMHNPPPPPRRRPPPGGALEYFFASATEWSTTHMRKDRTIFTCYAINEKNARRKFATWSASQELNTTPEA
jgi:hypothetical protein